MRNVETRSVGALSLRVGGWPSFFGSIVSFLPGIDGVPSAFSTASLYFDSTSTEPSSTVSGAETGTVFGTRHFSSYSPSGFLSLTQTRTRTCLRNTVLLPAVVFGETTAGNSQTTRSG